MGKNIFKLIENGLTLAKTTIETSDFVPIVEIDNAKEGENAMWSLENCDASVKETLTLSDDYDNDLRNYTIAEVIISKNSISKIPLKIIQGYDPLFFQDNDGDVEFSATSDKVTLEIEDGKADKKNEKEVTYGDEIMLKISHTLDRGDKFSIEIKGKDGDNIEVAGKLNFQIIDKDVFMHEEIKLLLSENKDSRDFNSNNTVPGNGYCIVAADRTLGALLNKKEDFYQEVAGKKIRLHKASTRADQIDSNGYIYKVGPILNHVQAYGETPYPNYTKGVHAFTTDNYHNENAPTKLQENLKDQILEDINGRIGHHIYYFTIHGQYHVMLLAVNYVNPCYIKFSILDQGYKQELDMDFENINDEFLSYVKQFWNIKNSNAKYILLWKIKR